MKAGRNILMVLVTAPDLKTARTLAIVVLKARLAACANLVPRIESHYWWQGKLEKSDEVLILFKTTKERLAALESLILQKHPYNTPEVISVAVAQGNAKYLTWVEGSVLQLNTRRTKQRRSG